MFEWYNQNLERFTRNGCSVYALYIIIQIQWGIKVDNSFIIATLQKAQEQKVWYETWGAYFGRIYNWFNEQIFLRTGVNIEVITLDIRSKKFEKLYKEGYAFGLGLKHAGRWYRSAREDWDITEEEIKEGDYGITYGHNHVYYNGLIVDTLGSISGKPITLSLENLRLAVDNGVYYPTCRTLYMRDKLLEKHLKKFQRKEKVLDVESLSEKEQKAIARASKLRVFKK